MVETDSLILSAQKWGLVLVMFLLIMFAVIKTRKNNKSGGDIEGHKGTLWLFAVVCWLVVVVSSYIRDMMSDDDGSDDKEESFLAFIPNFIVTVIWYGYISSALAWKVAGARKTGKFAMQVGKSPDSGAPAAYEGGRGFKGKRGGSGVTSEAERVGIRVDAIQDAAMYLVYAGIIMTMINVFSNLYLYYSCEDGGCPSDKFSNDMVRSIVSAQYNILIIGLLAIVFFYMDKPEFRQKMQDKLQRN